MWFDNHCHLTSLKGDPEAAVASAAEAGVTKLLTVGCSIEDSKQAIAIADRFDNVWATAGVHPHEAKDGIAGLEELLLGSEIVAVGGVWARLSLRPFTPPGSSLSLRPADRTGERASLGTGHSHPRSVGGDL